MTDAQRCRALLAHLKGSETLASDLLSLGCLSPVVRLIWEMNLRVMPAFISDASKALASIEAERASRVSVREGRGEG